MNIEIPSLGILVVVELGVVVLTVLATWQYARHHFSQRRAKPDAEQSTQRIEDLESALDNVAREVQELGESQDFVQELLTKRLNRLGLRPHAQPPAPERTPV